MIFVDVAVVIVVVIVVVVIVVIAVARDESAFFLIVVWKLRAGGGRGSFTLRQQKHGTDRNQQK